MEYRRLGRSGLMISELVLGALNFGNGTDADEAGRIIKRAIDEGINLFDCADVYAEGRSEEILGEILNKTGQRKNVLIASKAGLPSGPGPNDRGNSRHHVIESCEASLRRLGADYIDIFFLHRTDFNVPQEETLAALDLLVRQGKIRYAACSTHPAWRTVEALMIAEKYGYPKFVCEQPPYNLLDRRVENEIAPMCRAFDLGMICWSPLAQGILGGRYSDETVIPEGSRGAFKKIYRDRITQAGIDIARKLAGPAQEKKTTPARTAVAWVLAQPGVTATIIGPRTIEQFEDLLPAADLNLTSDDLEFCDRLVPPGGHVSNHFNTSGWMK